MMKERRHDDSRAETRRVIVERLARHDHGITIRPLVVVDHVPSRSATSRTVTRLAIGDGLGSPEGTVVCGAAPPASCSVSRRRRGMMALRLLNSDTSIARLRFCEDGTQPTPSDGRSVGLPARLFPIPVGGWVGFCRSSLFVHSRVGNDLHTESANATQLQPPLSFIMVAATWCASRPSSSRNAALARPAPADRGCAAPVSRLIDVESAVMIGTGWHDWQTCPPAPDTLLLVFVCCRSG
jgi:hypothetical protein